MARIKFDLETYKAHPEWKVETRNGWPARILCHDRRGERPLVVLVQQPDGFDDGRFYYESGLAEGAGYEMDGDLFLVTPEIPKSPNNIDEEAKQIAYNVCKDLPNGEEKDAIVYYAILAAIAGAKWMAGQGVKIGETKIYLEDDGGEPPYNSETWLDLESTEYAIPEDKFKDGDVVDVILLKK